MAARCCCIVLNNVLKRLPVTGSRFFGLDFSKFSLVFGLDFSFWFGF